MFVGVRRLLACTQINQMQSISRRGTVEVGASDHSTHAMRTGRLGSNAVIRGASTMGNQSRLVIEREGCDGGGIGASGVDSGSQQLAQSLQNSQVEAEESSEPQHPPATIAWHMASRAMEHGSTITP